MARTRIALTGALVLALLLLPLAPAAAAATTERVPGAAADFGLERDECPVDVPAAYEDRVTCHVLVVPERRTAEADPEKTLRLPVAVIKSSAADPADDPLVFPTTGGPGGGSLIALTHFLEDADWAADHDIILVEQRGDMLAEPTLNCPELDTKEFIVDGALLTGDVGALRWKEQLTACRERLIGEGIDLAAYSSTESASDLMQLRAALGYGSWNLYGLSYGSRLAMTVMRDHPDGLRSVILDGPYPPNVNRYESLPTGFLTAVNAMLAACADSADCNEAYPDLDERLSDVLDSAAAEPLPITVDSPVDGAPLRTETGDADLARGLFSALYSADSVRVLPYLIDQLSRGNAAPLLPLAQQDIDYRDYFTEGLDLSIECAEEVPFNDFPRLGEALAADPLLKHFHLADGLRPECATWAVPALSDIENQAVASGIPTLILNGGYDPVTPLTYGEAAAAALTTRYLYSFPAMGHGALWASTDDECPASIAEQFLTDPAAEPDASCIEQMPPTDFLTTADIYPTTAIYRFNGDLIEDRDPVQIGILAVTVLILIATLVYAIVYGLSWLVRRRGGAPQGAVLAAATASGLFLAFAGALAYVVLTTDPLILAFGIPPLMRPLIIVPLIAIAATILLTVVVVRAWIGGDGTTVHRVILSISAVGSIVFAVWLIVRGLLIF